MTARTLTMTAALAGAALLLAGEGTALAKPEAKKQPTEIKFCQTITEPGSYVLVANLEAVVDCLVVAADDVSIDLAGAVISGGIGDGITDGGDQRINITVRNGTVSGFGGSGVQLGNTVTAVIEGLRAIDNGQFGIAVRDGSTVTGNTVSGNGNDGVRAAIASAITGNTATGNSDAGIDAAQGSTVTGNTVFGNGGDGLLIGCPSNVIGNTATTNGGDNIDFNGSGCTDVNNLAP